VNSSEHSPGRAQRAVAEFVSAHGLEAPAHARALDLVADVGEVAKEILKGTDYGRVPFGVPKGWATELGDTFFSLLCLANSTGVDLEEALDEALEKYRERLALRGGVESDG
jgi:NTP pyrophosphatase (non-canonical NTP hydrolase)